MQAIQTKYLNPTNSKGSRIKAWCDAGQVTIPYPHEYSGMDCHMQAAKALQIKLGWVGKQYGALVGGGLPNNGGYCFVLVSAVDALGNLIDWAKGNRGRKDVNPYCVPEIVDSLRALQSLNGCADYLDAADQYRKGA